MVQFNTKDNEILVKIVYYGCGLSGKTTNLQKLHEMTDHKQKTDLFSVNTMEDRTLFFDLLPLELGYVYGNSIKLQIYTVPGQVHYDSTRRIVLSGADGVVFVADSASDKLQENVQSINNLYHNLQANRLNIKEIPLVMQYNKRDLENKVPIPLMNQKLNFREVPHFEAVAIKGEGVLETFLETVKQTIRYIFEKYQLAKNIKNVDGVIEKLETSIMSQARKIESDSEEDLAEPELDEEARTRPMGQTVLKYTHQFDGNDEPASQDQLLKQAITSNMETAQLYTKLKNSQEALVKKNEELQVLYQRLEKSNADNLKIRRFLESLVNFAGEAIMTFNELWVIQNWNKAAEELFGYTRDAVLNQNINILFPKSSLTDLNRVLSYVVSGKVVRGFETKLKSQSGQNLPVSITFSPIKNQNQTIVAFTAIVRDLSFVAKISHQLYTMQRFESVSGFLPALVSQIQNRVPNLDPDLSTTLDMINSLTLPPAGLTEPTNLNVLIGEIRGLLQPRFKKQNIGWAQQLFPTLPELNLDRQQIRRALLNLLLNAMDALSDRISGKITVGTHSANDEVLMQLIDNGSGLTHDELDHVFENTLNEKKNMIGIRFNVTREIVNDHGGKIRIDSSPDKGTKVTIRFPVS